MKNNILLDADQTILDFVRSSKESLAAAMREAGMPYAETDFSVYKRINDAISPSNVSPAFSPKRA